MACVGDKLEWCNEIVMQRKSAKKPIMPFYDSKKL
jgi:hypothetical protein